MLVSALPSTFIVGGTQVSVAEYAAGGGAPAEAVQEPEPVLEWALAQVLAWVSARHGRRCRTRCGCRLGRGPVPSPPASEHFNVRVSGLSSRRRYCRVPLVGATAAACNLKQADSVSTSVTRPW